MDKGRAASSKGAPGHGAQRGGGHQDRGARQSRYPSQQSNGGGGQWQRQAPPAMPSQPQL